MQWFFRASKQKPWVWNEPQVNCATCSIEKPLIREEKFSGPNRCCEFSPFWSAFAAGAWLESHSVGRLPTFIRNSKNLIPTILGVVHNPQHRLDASAPCGHFDVSNGQCQIWSQRPATCFHFFCTSAQSTGEQREQMEWAWLKQEAQWLEQWYLQDNPSGQEIWRLWGEYMQENSSHLPPQSLIISWEKAAVIYASAWRWLCVRTEPMNTSPEIRQQQLIKDFSQISNWEDRYKKIIKLGKDLPEGHPSLYDEKFLVKGCQSQVWMHASLDEQGRMQLSADSDAMIVKGLVALLLRVYSGATPQEVLQTSPRFVEELGFTEYLSPSRANGFLSMIKQIKLYAQAFQLTS